MNSDKILPIEFPIITGRMIYTYSTAIIMAHKKNYIKWMLNNFTCISFKDVSDYSSLDLAHDYNEFAPVLLGEDILTSSLVIDNNIEPIKLLIDENKYIIARVNKFYIPNTHFYKKLHQCHGLLIYGYDLSKETVYAMCFDKDVKMVFMPIKISDLINSIVNLDIKIQNKTTLLHYADVEYEFDPANVVNSIRNYMNLNVINNKVDTCQGVDVYDILVKQIDKFFLNIFGKPSEDFKFYFEIFSLVKNFHVLLDHKKSMQFKIRYFEENGLLNNDSLKLSGEFGSLCKDIEILRNVLLKLKFSKDVSILKNFKRIFEEMRNNEKIILTKFLNQLRN